MSGAERESSHADFWNERYAHDGHLFGNAPNAFIAEQAHRLPEGATVVELGAGEGRNAVFLALRGHAVTAVDFADVGLRKAGQLAHDAGVPLRLIQADLAEWDTVERWDAVVATFLQMLPPERPHLWRLVQRLLKPGGLFLGVFFRPGHITGGYDSGGPPVLDRMVAAEELRAHFPADGLIELREAEPVLADGPHLRGRAAVVQIVFQQPDRA